MAYDKRITDLAAIAAAAAAKNATTAPQLLMADITFTLADAVEDGRIILGSPIPSTRDATGAASVSAHPGDGQAYGRKPTDAELIAQLRKWGNRSPTYALRNGLAMDGFDVGTPWVLRQMKRLEKADRVERVPSTWAVMLVWSARGEA